VNKSLRDNSILLILQPAQENSIVQVETDIGIEFSEELIEPNFQRYLNATREAIFNVVMKGLFEIECEATTPEEGTYHCNEYDSIDEWKEDEQIFSADLAELNAMHDRIQKLIDGRKHRILIFWREYKVLLRKQ
jgi:hypothetical protein